MRGHRRSIIIGPEPELEPGEEAPAPVAAGISPDHPVWEKIVDWEARHRYALPEIVLETVFDSTLAKQAEQALQRAIQLHPVEWLSGNALAAAYGYSAVAPQIVVRMRAIYGVDVADDEIDLVLSLRQQICNEYIARRKSAPADLVPMVIERLNQYRIRQSQPVAALGTPIAPDAIPGRNS